MTYFGDSRGKRLALFVCVAALFSAAAFGQQAAPQGAVAGLPNLKGVYYRAGNAWENLPFSIMFPNTKTVWKWWLSVGNNEYYAALPGERALTQLTDAQPVFYVKGLATYMGPKLVQLSNKRDFRRVKMINRTLFEPRFPFHSSAVRDVELSQVSENVVSLRPRSSLPVGEYAIVTNAGPDQQRLYLGFDFRVGRP